MLAYFLIKTFPIVACFTKIALFLCINHDAIVQGTPTHNKKILEMVVVPLNFSQTFWHFCGIIFTFKPNYTRFYILFSMICNINYLETALLMLT
ncbi:MAG: hypothetical protein EA343_13830 [Nodularia sp. (in: Bacteria)]|nr:MAG: hypothetical protein EA343_13830 [Nodularia sp. (in: cyanobacteria)]